MNRTTGNSLQQKLAAILLLFSIAVAPSSAAAPPAGAAFVRARVAVLAGSALRSPAEASTATEGSAIDYEEPKLLTGTIYAKGPGPKRILFTFRRTASRSGPTIQVLREYNSPEGSLAARERVVYEKGKLISYDVEELQTGAKGRVMLVPNPQNNKKQKLLFEYTRRADAKTETNSEDPRKDILINDMIPPFLVGHWDELMKGAAVKFRFIVPQRLETIGFKLVKESETTWRGKPVVVIKMEPTSLLIAQLVEPVHFTIEQGGGRRIFQYAGRTTPMIKRGNRWEDLDAVTIFDWK